MPERAHPRPTAVAPPEAPSAAGPAMAGPRGTRPRRRPRWVLAAALPVVAVAAACSSSSTNGGGGGTTAVTGTTPGTLGINPAFSAFYQPPSPLPAGKPGDIIRSQPLTGTPAGSQGWVVLYHSTGLNGEDIAVSGMVIAPTGTTPGGPCERDERVVQVRRRVGLAGGLDDVVAHPDPGEAQLLGVARGPRHGVGAADPAVLG